MVDVKCLIEGCNRKARTGGYCNQHLRYFEGFSILRYPPCIEDGCNYPVHCDESARCYSHYTAWKYHQSVEIQYKQAHQNRIKAALNAQSVTRDSYTKKELGCSVSHMMSFLELQFYPNPITGELMSFENRGVIQPGFWQVHHKIMLSSVDLSIEEVRNKVFHYTNLQPLWTVDHKKVHNWG